MEFSKQGGGEDPWVGRRIVTTRAGEANAAVVKELAGRGAHVLEIATISFAEPQDYLSLDKGIAELPNYDWVVFTSVNGVRAFVRRLQHHGLGINILSGRKVAAVGPVTASALEEAGGTVDLIPERFQADALAPAMGDELNHSRILLVRAEIGREEFRRAAHAANAQVDLAVAYRTVPAERPPEADRILEEGKRPDMIMFASPSAVYAFHAMLSEHEKEALHNAPAACIGPVTGSAAAEYGFRVVAVPYDSTVPALIDAMNDYFRGKHVSD